MLASTQVSGDARGYRALLDFAQAQAPGRRCWAIEGAGSYGAGLSAFLTEHDEQVAEVCRPKRPPRAGARKSDAIDAVRAAREALSAEHLISPATAGNARPSGY
ncbi:MAG: IS110 family transposase [Streptosporangiaceae bacterium]